MFESMFDFIKRHIRYKRNIDKEVEEIWDLMIDGHAMNMHPLTLKERLINIVYNVVSFFICYITFFITRLNRTLSNPIPLIFMILLPIISNIIVRNVVKRTWLRIVIMLGIAALLGVLISLIYLIFE